VTAGTPLGGAAAMHDDAAYPRAGYAWYVVGVLTLVYVFSFIDRQILSLLVGPIRRDLAISDTQMSLLMGVSFAVFYTFFGMPLGRLADSRSRRTIIAAGFAFWSVFTAACGLAQNFLQMLLLRMGVGVGEAALSPAAYSLIWDYFPARRRALAISVYSMGIYVGAGLALFLGGTVTGLAAAKETWDLPIVGPTRPWQVVFFVVGLPGILLALLMYTVREPARPGRTAGSAAEGKHRVSQVPLGEVLGYFRQNWKTLFCHNVGFALLSFSGYGSSAWIPTFLVRNHGWSAREAGQTYGLIVAIFGALGVVAGGWLADWLSRRGYRDSVLRISWVAALLWLPAGLFVPLVASATVATWLLVPTVFLHSVPMGIAPAAIQQIMPPTMRGQASAVYLFVLNLIGLGIGPTAVAMVTDYVFGDDNAVRYSLAIVPTAAHAVAGLLLLMALKPFRQSLVRLQEWTAAHGADPRG
jgi:MFS family permease